MRRRRKSSLYSWSLCFFFPLLLFHWWSREDGQEKRRFNRKDHQRMGHEISYSLTEKGKKKTNTSELVTESTDWQTASLAVNREKEESIVRQIQHLSRSTFIRFSFYFFMSSSFCRLISKTNSGEMCKKKNVKRINFMYLLLFVKERNSFIHYWNPLIGLKRVVYVERERVNVKKKNSTIDQVDYFIVTREHYFSSCCKPVLYSSLLSLTTHEAKVAVFSFVFHFFLYTASKCSTLYVSFYILFDYWVRLGGKVNEMVFTTTKSTTVDRKVWLFLRSFLRIFGRFSLFSQTQPYESFCDHMYCVTVIFSFFSLYSSALRSYNRKEMKRASVWV